MRCPFSGFRVLLSSNTREVIGAGRRADSGADRGAIVLRSCRPLYQLRERAELRVRARHTFGHELAARTAMDEEPAAAREPPAPATGTALDYWARRRRAAACLFGHRDVSTRIT